MTLFFFSNDVYNLAWHCVMPSRHSIFFYSITVPPYICSSALMFSLSLATARVIQLIDTCESFFRRRTLGFPMKRCPWPPKREPCVYGCLRFLLEIIQAEAAATFFLYKQIWMRHMCLTWWAYIVLVFVCVCVCVFEWDTSTSYLDYFV